MLGNVALSSSMKKIQWDVWRLWYNWKNYLENNYLAYFGIHLVMIRYVSRNTHTHFAKFPATSTTIITKRIDMHNRDIHFTYHFRLREWDKGYVGENVSVFMWLKFSFILIMKRGEMLDMQFASFAYICDGLSLCVCVCVMKLTIAFWMNKQY